MAQRNGAVVSQKGGTNTRVLRGLLVVSVVLVASTAVISSAAVGANVTEWTVEETPVEEDINDVVYTSEGAYAVATGGVVLERTDEGWQTVINDGPSSNGNDLYGAGVTEDGDTLWFVGASGAIGEYDVKTGSLVDRSGPNDFTNNFRDIAVRNESGNASVYIVDGSGLVHRSFDNGRDGTWNDVTPGSGSELLAVDFHGPRSGHIVDGNQKVYSTDDGETWSDIGIADADVGFRGVDSDAPDDVWVSGGGGTVFDYDGAVWNNETISEVALKDIEVNGTGYAVGNSGEVLVSQAPEDGWTGETTETSQNLNAVSSESPRIAVGAGGTVVSREQAFVESSDLRISESGARGTSRIEMNAENGISDAVFEVSVNTSVANITGVTQGDGVNASNPNVTFNKVSVTEDSAVIEYNDTQPENTPVEGFEVANVEFEAQADEGETSVGINVTRLAAASQNEYMDIGEREGTLSISIFKQGLNIAGSQGPPQNIPESQGGFDDELIEDLDGDGDVTDTGSTVVAFGKLLRGDQLQDSGLSDDQARALDWNPFSPETEVQPRDLVTLFGKQLRAD